jgi:hypothetical protein
MRRSGGPGVKGFIRLMDIGDQYHPGMGIIKSEIQFNY